MSSNLKGSEICSIIKACAGSHVKELVFGDLKVSFRQRTDEVEEPQFVVANSAEDLNKMREIAAQEELRRKIIEEELAEAEFQITDPLGFETEFLNDGVVDAVE